MKMPAESPTARHRWRRDVVAVALAGVAVALALGAWLQLDRAARAVDEVRTQTAFVRDYERRALGCLDMASAAIGDPRRREAAEKSLEIARGITLCLVQHREDAQLRLGPLGSCIAEVEAANSLPAGRPAARPAC